MLLDREEVFALSGKVRQFRIVQLITIYKSICLSFSGCGDVTGAMITLLIISLL